MYLKNSVVGTKSLLDDALVPAGVYYYLLDFNDRNDKRLILQIAPESKGRLSLLEEDEFWALFKAATNMDLNTNWKIYL